MRHFFDCLDVIDDAQDVIRELIREHDVFIVSSALEIPESLAAKHRWLQRHFPFIPERNIVFCGDKGVINADYLIDDEARHFAGFRGTGLLFSAPHNLSETRYWRAANWQEIRLELLNGENDDAQIALLRRNRGAPPATKSHNGKVQHRLHT